MFVHQSWLPFEVVTSMKMNQAAANDDSFHDGSGILHPHKFFAYTGALYTGFPHATATKIHLTTESFDPDNDFDAATNYRFTAPSDGYYEFGGAISFDVFANTHCFATLYKNGAEWIRGNEGPSQNTTAAFTVQVSSGIVHLAAGDYVELWGYQAQGSTATVHGGTTPISTFLSGQLVSTS